MINMFSLIFKSGQAKTEAKLRMYYKKYMQYRISELKYVE